MFLSNLVYAQNNLNIDLLETNFGGSSEPKDLIKVNNKLYFTASTFDMNITTKRRLFYKENLNSKSVHIPVNNDPEQTLTLIGNINSTLYFLVDKGFSNNIELWKTDGSQASTSLVRVLDNSNDGQITNFSFVGNHIFFIISKSGNYRLWHSDGTANNTSVLDSYSNISGLSVKDSTVLYSASKSNTGSQIYQSNGTIAGTTSITNFSSTSQIGNVMVSDKNVYFIKYENLISKLYKMQNGIVSEIKQLSGSDRHIKGGLCNGKLVFFSSEILNGNYRDVLYQFDEESEFLEKLADYYYTDDNVYEFKNKLYYTVYDTQFNSAWMSTDGTLQETKNLSEIFGISNLSVLKISRDRENLILKNQADVLLFNGINTSLTKIEKESESFAFNYDMDFISYGNAIVFGASNNLNGNELFSSNGYATNLLEDLNHLSGTGFFNPIDLNGKLIFFGNDYDSGAEPFISDGTPAGTHLIKDINVGSGGSVYTNDNPTFFKNGNKLFFRCTDGSGYEPCVTDGTPEGTRKIKKIGDNYYGSVGVDPYFMSLNENEVLFASAMNNNNSSGNYNLWKTDGTPEGTNFVHSVYPEVLSSDLKVKSANINGVAYFVGRENIGSDVGIWKSDGTSSGTQFVKKLTAQNGTVLFPRIIGQNDSKIFILTYHYNVATKNIYVFDTTSNEFSIIGSVGSNLPYFHHHDNKITFLADNKLIIINMDSQQITRSTYSTDSFTEHNFVDFNQCGENLYVHQHNSMYGYSSLYKINDVENSKLDINNDAIQSAACLNSRLLYSSRLINSYPIKQIKITDGTTSSVLPIYYKNSEVDLSKSLTSISKIIKSGNNILMHGFLHNEELAGYEIYNLVNWTDILSSEEIKNYKTAKENEIALYPNPSSGLISLKSLVEKVNIEKVTIYDVIGNKVQEFDKIFLNKDISKLLPGMYFVKVKTTKGTIVKKLIKQ